MATNEPNNQPADQPIDGFASGPEPDRVPGWRTPLALVGWGLLIATLIGIIVYGLMLLSQQSGSEPVPATSTTAGPSPTSTLPSTSETPTATTVTTTPPTTTPPTTTTENTGAPVTTSSHGWWTLPFPHPKPKPSH